jgi:iduronate 2-sulfatase
MKLIIFCTVLLQLYLPLSAVNKKMNVLFIAVDDMNNDLNCYGVKQVITPHIDKLAAAGVLFDRAYCQFPVCGQSRASIMMGLRPNTSGFLKKRDNLRRLQPDVVTLGQFFQKKGYVSARVGKIYHYSNPYSIGTNGNDDKATWNERYNPKGIDRTQEKNITRYGKSKNPKALGISMAWWDPKSEDTDHTDGKVASKAIELIEKHKDKPFFLAVGFFNPHCPYVAPKKYFDLYNIKDIKMQDLKTAKESLSDVPAMALKRDSTNWPYFFDGVTLDEAKQCKLAYYACISFVDAQVGRIMAALKKNNLEDNTIVIFWSDHGYFLGEKGLWYKYKNFERSLRSPLIITGPNVKARNQVCYQPVELLDLYPTLADMTGHKVPEVLEGKSLRPLLDNAKATWTKPAISQVYYTKEEQGYSIRTARYRYTEWNGGKAGEELYDHQKDPHENKNLAGNKEYQPIKKELKEALSPYVKY